MLEKEMVTEGYAHYRRESFLKCDLISFSVALKDEVNESTYFSSKDGLTVLIPSMSNGLYTLVSTTTPVAL